VNTFVSALDAIIAIDVFSVGGIKNYIKETARAAGTHGYDKAMRQHEAGWAWGVF